MDFLLCLMNVVFIIRFRAAGCQIRFFLPKSAGICGGGANWLHRDFLRKAGMAMQDEKLRERLDARTSIYNGHVINLEKWDVTLPNGKPAMREVAIHKGASAIVPVDDEGYVYLVRQFRTPLQRVLTEVPAGKLDSAGEDHLVAAKRELHEETGFTAKKWTHLVDLATTPGFCTETISLYLAEGLTRGETDFDDDEFLDLVRMPLNEAVRTALTGGFEDAKTIAALLLAAHARKGEGAPC
jgi:ADP-ribose pyrophosphatase